VTITVSGSSLVVSDTGPGIPPEDVPHAFERFYLYDKVGRDRPVGSGLGLAIVKQLATAMGGSVRVDSSSGGTSFTVALRPHRGGVDHLEVGPRQSAQRV
jgi:signal transduction histidine kinase